MEKSNNRLLACIGICILILASCRSTKPVLNVKNVIQIDTIELFKHSFHGLHIIDAQEGNTVFTQNADKYFVPASNTKLLSLLSGLSTYPDSIPFIKYSESDTAVVFEGLGDPTFLHPYFDQSRVLDFFKSKSQKKFYYYEAFDQKRQGRGWMWDDYQYDYQAELSPLPMYGNLVFFKVGVDSLITDPPYFKKLTSIDDKMKGDEIRRLIGSNHYIVPTSLLKSKLFTTEYKPFITDQATILDLLRDTLKIQIQATTLPPTQTTIYYSHPKDTMLALMMKLSDNMMAEQTLLSAGKILTDTFNTEIAIRKMINLHLTDLPHPLRWSDGSGLSRYNMFTPMSVVHVLQKLYKTYPRARLFKLMATGGQRGTLSSLFKGDPPYVFAKTGTLSGVANISGYLVTKSNKILIFSFMNNNFVVPASSIRKEMEKVLNKIRDEY
jgi:D-alanyl-D-alanine carboxypeptidase/D-alanyl-D-alanine-endopeptidase (penicillin-binding protein 4)